MNDITKINPLLCDPETGICEIPAANEEATANPTHDGPKPVKLLYFTDPICSSCWGIEPQLRKLKLEYGHLMEIEYRMGGLLPSWETYGGRDVGKPTDVAHHWEEVAPHYDMPIDGDVWLTDPLASSFPPSVAFKAAQLQGEEKALIYLRRIKEMVFLEKKNIAKEAVLVQAAEETGLDLEKFRSDLAGPAEEIFKEDLALARHLGVRGFPTIFFTDADGNRFLVYGFKPYEQYEQALLKLYPEAQKKAIEPTAVYAFSHYPTLTTREFTTITGLEKPVAEKLLHELVSQNELSKLEIKNGTLWRKNSLK